MKNNNNRKIETYHNRSNILSQQMYDTAASPSGTSEFLLRRLDSHFTQKTINFIYLLKAERCNVNVRAGRDIRLRVQDTRLGRSAPPLCYNIGTGRQIFHDWNLCTFSRPCTCAVHQTIGMSSGYIFNKYFFFFFKCLFEAFFKGMYAEHWYNFPSYSQLSRFLCVSD